MKKKHWRRFLVCLLTVSMVFTWTAAPRAAEKSAGKISGLNTVYVTSSSGLASGDGSSKDKPLHDIKKAFDAAADGGAIVIVDFYVDSDQDQKAMMTPSDKKLTIKGENHNVSLTLRYGTILGNDLKFDRIKLETTSTDPQSRHFYVNGYSLTITDSVQCFVNNNWNQKAYIYAGSPDGSVITGRRAKIDVGGGNFAGIYGYGKNGAEVLEGTDISIRDNTLIDRLDTASVVNIYTKQTLLEAARNIDLLNIAAPLDTYDLLNVKNITLNSDLKLTTEKGITLEGNLDMRGDANLDIKSDLHIKGKLIGSGMITPWFRGQVVSDQKDSNGNLTFQNDVTSWEIRTEDTASGKRWYAAPKRTESVYYIDGTLGNDGNTGQSADQAFASMKKAMDVLKTADSVKQNISLIISGDTIVDESLDLSLPGHTFSVSSIGSVPAKLTFHKPLTIGENTEFNHLVMDFTGCAGQDSIVIDTDMVVFEESLSMEGTPPDIRYTKNVGDSAQQAEIFSGTYGDIKSENKEAYLILHNGSVQGNISGWGYVFAAPESWERDEIFVKGGIQGTGCLEMTSGTDSFTVDGDIQVESIETDGQSANLKVTSGSQIVVGEFDPQVSLTILAKQETISEGTYLTADSFTGNTVISRLKLKNTKGYILSVQKDGEKYTGTLKAAAPLENPKQIMWDVKGGGKLTWDKVPNAEKYLVTVFKGDEEIFTGESNTESMDCSEDLKRYGKGGYKAAVQAVSDTDEYSDSEISYSSLLSYHIKAESIILSTDTKELNIGETFQLKAKAQPNSADCGFLWSSSDDSIVKVDGDGNVTAVSLGAAKITAEADDASGVTASCQITVKEKIVQKVEKIVLSQTEKTLYAGESFNLAADVQPQNAEDRAVKWSSSAPKVVAVGNSGKVTALSNGQAEVTAEANDGSGVTASCQITVKEKPVQKVEKIVLNKNKQTLYAGESFTLTADVQPKNAVDRTVKWSSSDPKIVTVSNSGKVTAQTEGRAVVTATASDGSGMRAGCTVTVAARTYSVQYILNGGRNHRDNPLSFTNPSFRLKAPAREGYLFSGWYTDAGFHNKIDTISQKKDYRLYAKWQKVSLKAPKVQNLKKTVKTSISVSYSRVPGAAGYEVSVSTDSRFRSSATKKWITTAAQKTAGGLKSNAQYYTRIRAYRVDSARKKVYGPYSAKTKGYSIKYRLNKGKNSSQNLVSYYNTSVRLKNPSRKGYRFKGWYTSKKYKKRIKSISKGKRINYTLYAKWKKK